MYLEHYQIKLKPFEIDPDPEFLWLGKKHKEAFAALESVILENKGVACLMGEPGTGKSTLLNGLALSSGNQILSAKILDPSLSERDFFNLVADGFEFEKSFKSREDFFAYLRHFTLDAFANAKKAVLIIDEAHRLSARLLEQIQLISKIKMGNRFLINIVFAGQNEFGEVLKANQAFSQAIMSYTLQPLTEAETAEYITHRLRVAGSTTEIFTSRAIVEIFRRSGGIPRLINIISDNALLSGYALKIKKIGPEIILGSQGPGHRLVHEICELDKEFAAQHPVHSQNHREGAVLAIEAQTPKKKRPPGTITRFWQSLLEKSRLKPLPFRVRGALAAAVSLTVLLGIFGYFYFPNADGDQPLTKVQAHSEQIPSPQTILQTEASLNAPSGLKGAASAAENKKQAGSADRQSSIAVSSNEDRTRAPDIAGLQDQLRSLLQQLQTAFDAKAQLEQNLKALEKELSLEKGSKGKLSAEASAKEAELQELRKTLEASKSQQLALADEVKKVKSDNAQLQGQLADLKSRKAAAPASSDVSKMPAAPKPAVDRSEKEGAAQPAPTDIIDFVIKKKTQ